jgi:CBS domain-containing protein
MSANIPTQLKETADQVNQGSERHETVRTLLSWFGAERRGYWKVREIRKALNKVKLRTDPDFEEAWIDAPVVFASKANKAKTTVSEEVIPAPDGASLKALEGGDGSPVPKKASGDVNSRIKIGMLAAANRPPLCVSPDTEVSEAITLMLQYDYSQLPVTTTERDVKGIISWKSLGSRLALGKQCSKVRECMEVANEIRTDTSLFEAIQQIVEHQFVLVRDTTHKLAGIVTTADLSLQFAQLGEPFLLLGQIESHLRNLIADRYTKAELADACESADSGREIEDVADLTLGEHIRLLDNPKRWEKLAIKINRKTFVCELNRVRRIRNDVMHFDPDGVGPEDLTILRKFARFLSDLESKLV